MPRHLDPAAGGECDGQPAVWFFGHHLVPVKRELARRSSSTWRKTPDDRLVFLVRVVGAERLGGVGVQVEVGVGRPLVRSMLMASKKVEPSGLTLKLKSSLPKRPISARAENPVLKAKAASSAAVASPVPVLLGFCDFGQKHAALRHSGSDLILRRQHARMPACYAPNPVKQGIWPPGPERRVDTG
jgi:hypothetical protein